MTATLTPEKPVSTLADVRLKDILKTLPRSCFQRNPKKAWASVAFSSFAVCLGLWSLATLPWFLLPLGWVFTGTALTGCFVIAHDCGHRSFAKRRWVNDLVGHVMTLPLIYPFHSWRLLHDRHHAHTNKLGVDNAWEPFKPEFYDSLGRLGQWGYQALRGRFWWIASIVHWAVLHFDPNQVQPKHRDQVKFSVTVVVIFAAIAFPLLIATTGIWGFVKFWLLPWLVYHFWMSTFTLVHHTAPEIEFREPQDWKAAEAQLAGTVHCDYPMWVERLCHHINVHVPHHLSTAIPSYNLRMAHQSLQQNWGVHLQEQQFSWKLMQKITDRCHLYDASTGYQTFQEYHTKNK
jgi:acyl-lipid omega-6 desaturase (Delta-12 desaturase)